MRIVYLKPQAQHYLVDGLLDFDYTELPLSVNDVWSNDKEKINECFDIIDPHTSKEGFLVYKEKEGSWYWQVFDKPREVIGRGFMGASIEYAKVEIVKEIPLTDLRKSTKGKEWGVEKTD